MHCSVVVSSLVPVVVVVVAVVALPWWQIANFLDSSCVKRLVIFALVA